MQLFDKIVSTQQPVDADIQTKCSLVKKDFQDTNNLISLLSDFFEKNSSSETKQFILEPKKDKLQKKVNPNKGETTTSKKMTENYSKPQEDFIQQQNHGGFPCQSAGQSKALDKEYFKNRETNFKFNEKNKKNGFYKEDFNSDISSCVSSKASQISLLSELDISNEANSSKWTETEFFMNPIYKSQSEPDKNGSYKKLINKSLKPHHSEFQLQTFDSTNCHQLYKKPKISTSSDLLHKSQSFTNLYSKSKITKWTNKLLSRFEQHQKNEKEKYNILDKLTTTECGINSLDLQSILYPSSGFFEEKNLEVHVDVDDYANDVSVASLDKNCFQKQLISSTNLYSSFEKDKNEQLKKFESNLSVPQLEPLDLRVKPQIPSTCHKQTLKRKSNQSDFFSLEERKQTPKNEKNLSCYFGNKFVKKVAVDLDFGAVRNQNTMTMNFFSDDNYHRQTR